MIKNLDDLRATISEEYNKFYVVFPYLNEAGRNEEAKYSAWDSFLDFCSTATDALEALENDDPTWCYKDTLEILRNSKGVLRVLHRLADEEKAAAEKAAAEKAAAEKAAAEKAARERKVVWCENFIRSTFAKHCIVPGGGIEVGCFWDMAERSGLWLRGSYGSPMSVALGNLTKVDFVSDDDGNHLYDVFRLK